MVKSASRSIKDKMPYTGIWSGLDYEYIAWSESLDGSYGREKQNAVSHMKATTTSHAFWRLESGQRARTFSNEAQMGLSELMQYIQPALDSSEYMALNALWKQLDPVDTSFSIANFLYELRELPALLDPFKIAHKRLARTKSGIRMTKRQRLAYGQDLAKDVGGTYVNAQFGYTPTISDGFEIMKRYRNLVSSYEDLNRKLQKKRRFGFHFDVPVKRSIDIPCPWAQYFMTGPTSEMTAKLKVTKATMSVSGRSHYEAPNFSSLGFTTAVLDRGGLYFDLATLWNAVPFSWAVDWILPIGDALAADRVSWTDIDVKVNGTFSWKIEYEIQYPDPKSVKWDGWSPTASKGGKTVGTIYFRTAIPSIRAYRYPPLKLGFGDWSAKRAGILAGIGTGFAPDSAKGQKRSRRRPTKVRVKR